MKRPHYTDAFVDESIRGQHCIRALDAYTGTDFQTSQYGFVALAPGEDTWNSAEDRELVCIGTTVDASGVLETTGSIKAG